MKKLKFTIFFSVVCLIFLGLGSFGLDVLAQTEANNLLFGGQQGALQAALGLGAEDPRIVVANVIRVALGFLGIIAVSLVIYAGWLWMTSQGKPDQIDRAKKILVAAAIGLVIILMSFGIATFIMSKLLGATQSGGGDFNCSTGLVYCAGIGCQVPPCSNIVPSGENIFLLNSTTPANGSTNVVRNAKVRFIFNSAVNGSVITLGSAGNLHVTNASGADIAGNFSVNSNRVEFVPSDLCPENACSATNCLPANSVVNIKVDNGASGILSVGDMQLTCDLAHPCEASFNTSDLIDCSDPVVSFDFNQVCAVAGNQLYALSSDDSGVYALEYSADGVLVPNVPIGNNPIVNPLADSPFDTRSETPARPSVWNGSSLLPGTLVNFSIKAYDLADRSASVNRNMILRPSHCCNGVSDGDETGVDCGGACAGCSGSACGINLKSDCSANSIDCSANDNLCLSNSCDCSNAGSTICQNAGYDAGITNCCLCQDIPIIDWISPVGGFCAGGVDTPCSTNQDCAAFTPATCDNSKANGATGNIVTIGGRYFGSNKGSVQFSIDNGVSWANASLASDVNTNCANSWADDQIIAVVPGGLASGKKAIVKIITSSGVEETTANNIGASVDFLVNNIKRPGLCGLDPDHGRLNAAIRYYGINLSTGSAHFGNLLNNVLGQNFVFVNSTNVQANVPNIQVGKTTTFVSNTALINSNYVNFTKDEEASLEPYIISFEPVAGAPGQYVTIYGSGFGGAKGSSKVFFGDEATGEEASYDFPEICADSVWSDNQIIVKVPETANNFYTITVSLNGTKNIDTSKLNPAQFQIDSNRAITPSLCKIQPLMGPNNSEVSLWGEYFGTTPGVVRFYSNKDQGAANISFWGKEENVERINTTVHPDATTGPVKAIKGGVESNGLNFKVGLCTEASNPDEACGTQVCCPAGTFEEGRCKDSLDQCSVKIPSSVYEWDFSTAAGVTTCASDQVACGDVCCSKTNSCDAANPNKCAACEVDQNECGDGNCCNAGCINYLGSSVSSCPPACSGYDLAQCGDNFCPNSPGQCSASSGGTPELLGNCVFNCDNVGSCTAATCSYNDKLDKCVKNNSSCDLKMTFKNILGNNVEGYCDKYGTEGRWYINTELSCPDANWVKIFGGKCVNTSLTCDMCVSGFKCQEDYDNDNQGLCAIDKDICPGNSKCNSSGECVKSKDASCDCCCEIGQDSRDCCAPLTCKGTCGNDTTDDGSGFGVCSGCADVGTTQAEHDAACNCAGTKGKFCDTSVAGGVCSDCAGLDASECSTHGSSCCFDVKNGINSCRGGDGSLLSGGLCAYYNCQAEPNNDQCDLNPLSNGTYKDIPLCSSECAKGSVGDGAGLSCAGKTDTACNTDICSNPFSCLNDDGTGPSAPSSCGVCCCDPANDVCGTLNPSYPNLTCQPNKGACTGDGRGLCCGCGTDADCGNPDNVGCGKDTCCQARPSLIPPTYPADNDQNICRNTLITATFDQLMDPASFSGNIIVVGDYGTSPCPEGTEYLASETFLNKKLNSNIAVRVFHNLVAKVQRVISTIFPSYGAQAYTNPVPNFNYCAIRGEISSYNNAIKQSVLEFKPSQALEGNKLYYVIVKGDENLDGSTGVLSAAGIGMNGPANSNNIFNGIVYNNSYIWSFKTLSAQSPNSGICKLDHIEIEPVSYLFSTNINNQGENDLDPNNPTFDTIKDSDKVFIVLSKNSEGKLITPLPQYNWGLTWHIVNPTIANEVTPNVLSDDKRLIRANKDVTEGNTKLTVSAQITADNIFSPATTGSLFNTNATVYVFVCENPWPPVDGVTGLWQPWSDNVEGMNCIPGTGTCRNTNYILYYCRDAGKTGTADDLPAILSDSTVIRGESSNLLKESYFLREQKPGGSAALRVADLLVGDSVKASWDAISGVKGYKLYWGVSPSNYTNNKDVGSVLTYNVTGLIPGKTYYFNLTSYLASGAESDYYNEVQVVPTDKTAPSSPMNLSVVPGIGEVTLKWNAVVGAAKYKWYYGITPLTRVYGQSGEINDPAIIVSGLTAGTTYYFAVTAIDAAGNESDYSTEVNAIAK